MKLDLLSLKTIEYSQEIRVAKGCLGIYRVLVEGPRGLTEDLFSG